MKEQLTDLEIHYLTKKNFIEVLSENPRIDKLITIDKSIKEVISDLQREKYDHIVDLHNNLRTRSLTWRLKAKVTRFPKLNVKKWLLVKLKSDRLPEVHVVDRYFEAVRDLKVTNNNSPVEFFIAKNNEVNPADYGLESGKYISLAIGAQFATKRMPEELLEKILNKIEGKVALVGGPTDVLLADSLASKHQNVINLAGKLNLQQSASIVRQGERLLTNDTGMMHIASAFDLPIISVWGNTSPKFGMYPYRPFNRDSYTIHEVSGLSCRPCSKIGYQKCPKGHFKCMLEQDVPAITKALLD